jgi:hypothetical protein
MLSRAASCDGQQHLIRVLRLAVSNDMSSGTAIDTLLFGNASRIRPYTGPCSAQLSDSGIKGRKTLPGKWQLYHSNSYNYKLKLNHRSIASQEERGFIGLGLGLRLRKREQW